MTTSPKNWSKHAMPYQSFLDEWAEYGITNEDVLTFLQTISVTPEEQREIMKAEQGSEKWLNSRGKRLTASNFGAVCGQNPYSSANRVLKDMLWPRFFTCEAVRWGQSHEKIAAKLFEEYIRAKDPEIVAITYPGLVVSQEKFWFGASPDGIVHLRNGKMKGLEIKCPAKKELYPYCPAYYFAQIQGTAGFLGFSSYYFVVWTPEVMQIEEYSFERDYFHHVMIPTMEQFYFDRYLPLAILKEKQLLPIDSIKPRSLSVSIVEESKEPEVPCTPPDFIWSE